MKAVKGQWVQIEAQILSPKERAQGIPEDTSKLPYVMRVKGYLEDDEAAPGDTVSIRTLIQRLLTGKLLEVEPAYKHNFGSHVAELADAGNTISQLFRSLEDKGH